MKNQQNTWTIIGALSYIICSFVRQFTDLLDKVPHFIVIGWMLASCICLAVGIRKTSRNSKLWKWKRRVLFRKKD